MMDIDVSTPPVTGAAGDHASSVPASRRGEATTTGAERDFASFYDEAAQMIARALTATLGDPELAADATNEAMTRAYQRWDRIGHYDNPAGWVYRVGLNWALSWKRRRRRERERPVSAASGVVAPPGRDDTVDAALARLSVESRAVVVCRIHLDWSVEVTAEALDIAAGTVKSRLARALEQLRSSIEIERRRIGD